MTKQVTILAISGSLRRKSSNTALMHAIMDLAPDSMKFAVFTGLGDLPHFNPDIDDEEGPESVFAFRKQLEAADGVLICTPEYGNGVPGVLKNALDWLVSSGEFMNKPTAVVSASPTPMGGDKAHASLLLTLNMINALVIEKGKIVIPHITLKLDQQGEIVHLGTRQQLAEMLGELLEVCAARGSGNSGETIE